MEDDASHAELLMRCLVRHEIHCVVHHVVDGEGAMDYLLRRGKYSDPAASPRPRIVLMDLRLPKIDGLELLEQIKSCPSLQKTPIVVLTTSAMESEITKAYARQANSVLCKPTDYSEFVEMVDCLARYWLQWNRNPWTAESSASSTPSSQSRQ
ncbi:MAG: response regulator [Pirellulales bacterium]|nr:response regulator [Pirellulales bacterium]